MLMLGLRTLSVRTFREGTMTLSSLPWILRLIRSTYGIGSGKSAGVIAFTGTRGGTLPGTILTSELRGPLRSAHRRVAQQRHWHHSLDHVGDFVERR